jgi:hypothetical protein
MAKSTKPVKKLTLFKETLRRLKIKTGIKPGSGETDCSGNSYETNPMTGSKFGGCDISG